MSTLLVGLESAAAVMTTTTMKIMNFKEENILGFLKTKMSLNF
jgi:hypothetical protein